MLRLPRPGVDRVNFRNREWWRDKVLRSARRRRPTTNRCSPNRPARATSRSRAVSWAKSSGARLDILWRERQDYDSINGWTGARLTELIRIEIRPASGPPVIWVETGK